jgi:hypothetical protein
MANNIKRKGLRNKYAKIPLKSKLMFLKKVIYDNCSIRDVKLIDKLSPQFYLKLITLQLRL